MSKISLRQAHPTDWPAVEALLKAHQLPLAGAREHLSTFVIAEAGREIVGCAGAEPRGDVALLRSVAVAPGLLRQGIGGQMVALVLQEARRRGFRAVYLLTATGRDYFARASCSPTARRHRRPCGRRPSSRAPARPMPT
jgi:N-acetylglutamate synthase-like GNAT family acetyltransferase